jgi:hypothetical protein
MTEIPRTTTTTLKMGENDARKSAVKKIINHLNQWLRKISIHKEQRTEE